MQLKAINMKRKLIFIFSIIILSTVIFIGHIYVSAPIPTVFKVTGSPLKIKVGTKVKFLQEYYPDESFLTFKCTCEDESIAKVDDDKEIVTGISKGTSVIECEARGTHLATIEVIVE